MAAIGLTFRRSPAIAAIREQVRDGVLGPVRHFAGRYWCDYGADPDAPISWRYRGGPGSGALADIGSHLVDLGEFFCGPVASVAGTAFLTAVKDRPVPLGVAVGHAGGVALGDTREPVENEDVAMFTATFAAGAVGTFAVSRIAPGHSNTLTFEVSCERGGAAFDLDRVAEFSIADGSPPRPERLPHRAGRAGSPVRGRRAADGLPRCRPRPDDLFVYQARALLEQVAGVSAAAAAARRLTTGCTTCGSLDAVTALRRGRRRRRLSVTVTPPPLTHRKEHPCNSAPTTPACTTSRCPRPSTIIAGSG